MDSEQARGRDHRRSASAADDRADDGLERDLPAWETLGDGYWLPQRVRGSNRGRALG